MQLLEESTSQGSSVWWTMTLHSSSGCTFTGTFSPFRRRCRLLLSRLNVYMSFVFRVGRTARAGKSGLAFTFLLRVQVCDGDWRCTDSEDGELKPHSLPVLSGEEVSPDGAGGWKSWTAEADSEAGESEEHGGALRRNSAGAGWCRQGDRRPPRVLVNKCNVVKKWFYFLSFTEREDQMTSFNPKYVLFLIKMHLIWVSFFFYIFHHFWNFKLYLEIITFPLIFFLDPIPPTCFYSFLMLILKKQTWSRSVTLHLISIESLWTSEQWATSGL